MANSENTKDGNSHIIENSHSNDSLLRYNNTDKEGNNEPNRRESQRNSPVQRHSGSHGLSGNGQHTTVTESAQESGLDEGLGELFMWASRNRNETATRSKSQQTSTQLNGTSGDSNAGSLRPTNQFTGRESSIEPTSGVSVGAVQRDLSDLEESPQKSQYKIIETVHTQKGHNLYVVQLPERVERNQFNKINSKAKSLKGYYSTYSKRGAVPGFQFKQKVNRRVFD